MNEPPDGRGAPVLLVADETALTAALGILKSLALLPTPPRVQAFFEVLLSTDFQNLDHYLSLPSIGWRASSPHQFHQPYG
ncbi:SIP domain-containing protein [Sodalis-like endosymbiont of Proechinophthirus fluctus]|uniref:SIP domain-containing protein n=1 Tax=Sodalis-like endosymbiont of Proechinophthirus fluctus TaxID=1462730 RepID=UPI00082EA2AC|nr:SIP domain-containing protein [Sodalis-like endosymbiont of Proechinophthirus fluctus]